VSSAPPLDMVSCKGSCSCSVVSLKPYTASVLRPRAGPFISLFETEVEPVENPIDEATTVAEMLRRPAVSADPQVVGAASAEPQVIGAAPFRMVMGQERTWGTFSFAKRKRTK
jgi:hypothetical protein